MHDWRVDPRKIIDYLLSATSDAGAAKNRFFRAVGFMPDAWDVMRDALVAHPLTANRREIDTASPYGTKHVFRCRLTTPDRSDPCILTVWQYRHGDYWLVTAYPFA